MSKFLCVLICSRLQCSAAQCRSLRRTLRMCEYVCVCVSRWLCVHSTVNWSGCSLDWMEKGPGQEVHSASADGRARCVAITQHSSSTGHAQRGHASRLTQHHHTHPSSSSSSFCSRGLFEPVSWRWRRQSFLLFLIWPSKAMHEDSRLTGKGGGLFF